MIFKKILGFNIFYHLREFSKRKKLIVLFSTLVVFILLVSSVTVFAFQASTAEGRVLGVSSKPFVFRKKTVSIVSPISQTKPTLTPTPSNTPTPTIKPSPTPTTKPTSTPTPTVANSKTYNAEKVGDTTYKVHNVSNDSSMAGAQDIFNALNSYRTSYGVGTLSWDNKLSDLASTRVNTFAGAGSLDNHAGFRDFMNNGGFDKAGFNGLGENSAALSGPMSGDKIINDIFGADGDHDGNQLNASWTHAAVAVNGNFVNVNFGKNKQ